MDVEYMQDGLGYRSLEGFAPQTPHQGGSAPLDPPKYGPVTSQYGDCVQDCLDTPQDGVATPKDALVTPPMGIMCRPL